MKRLALLVIIAVTLCPAVKGEGFQKVLRTLCAGDVSIVCDNPGTWNFEAGTKQEDGV